MITNLAWFALLPVILLASPGSVSAEPRFVPAKSEPILPVPASTTLDPDKVALGDQLFNDTRLSDDNSLSCASCHKLVNGGDDDTAIGLSMGDKAHTVNTPTVFNARFNFRQHWDGAAASLEQQIDHVVLSHKDAGTSWDRLLARLNKDPVLAGSFGQIYPDGITRENYLDALVEFEKSLVTPNSRFDQYLLGNDTAITDDEKKGYSRFKELGCISCHQGVNVGGNLFQKFGIFYDYLGERSHPVNADYGRINITNREADMHVFKVPSLRNIELTAPYLHDGSAGSLEDAIRIMGKTQIGKTISNEDVMLLVKFLKTLTGEYKGKSLAEHGSHAGAASQRKPIRLIDNEPDSIQNNRENS